MYKRALQYLYPKVWKWQKFINPISASGCSTSSRQNH